MKGQSVYQFHFRDQLGHREACESEGSSQAPLPRSPETYRPIALRFCGVQDSRLGETQHVTQLAPPTAHARRRHWVRGAEACMPS
jgi:hypothetical protein